ncbi:hypothetical protein ABES58_29980 [Paenibacillus lautus]|uniref:hypothetical protein n=1 Tax=Paenibacillus lautus TaxID=1401 RepID=UPI003D2CCC62
MGEIERIVKVKLKQHATLILSTALTGKYSEKYWQFTSPDVTRHYSSLEENDPSELIEILDDLSIEGWELVCPLIGEEDGYILRTIEYKDDTITIYGDEQEIKDLYKKN